MKFAYRAGFASLLALSLAACGSSGETPGDSASPAAEQSAADTAPAAAEATTPADAAPLAFAQCKACHSVEPGKAMIGPSLAGIVGAKSGAVAGFAYSDAFKKLAITWDEANLDTWLTNPSVMAPGTKMAYPGMANAADRKAVIDYLKTLK